MSNNALALLPLALAYIMFTLGTGLKPSDFKVIVNHPKAFIVGLINQVIFVFGCVSGRLSHVAATCYCLWYHAD